MSPSLSKVFGLSSNHYYCWDSVTGLLLWTTNKSQAANTLVLSNDGTKLLTTNDSGQYVILNTADGSVFGTMPNVPSNTFVIRFNSDGTQIVAGTNSRTLVFMSALDGSVIRTVTGLPSTPDKLAISPDGTMYTYFITAAGSIRVASYANDTVIFEKQVAPTTGAIMFTADSSQVIYSYAKAPDYGINFDDSHTGFTMKHLGNIADQVDHVAFTPDGSKLVSGGHDRKVRFWDTGSGALLNTWSYWNSTINSLSISPDNIHIAISSSFSPLEIRSLVDGSLLKTLDTPGIGCYSPDGSILAVCSNTAVTTLYSTSDWSVLKSWSGQPISFSMCFSKDSRFLAQGGDSYYQVVDISNASTVFQRTNQSGLFCVCFIGNTHNLAVTGSYARAYDIDTGQELYRDTTNFYNKAIVACSPDGRYFYCADTYALTNFFAKNGSVLDRLTHECLKGVSIAVSPDNKSLAIGRTDGTIAMFRAPNGLKLAWPSP